jgi:hypothetical protein
MIKQANIEFKGKDLEVVYTYEADPPDESTGFKGAKYVEIYSVIYDGAELYDFLYALDCAYITQIEEIILEDHD